MKPIHVICATRGTTEAFFSDSLLGRYLASYKNLYRVHLSLVHGNNEGLPTVYNRELAKLQGQDVIVLFVHDDLAPLDFFWPQMLAAGMENFDILGLVGNLGRVPMQPTWMHVLAKNATSMEIIPDNPANLSGAMGYGSEFPCHVGYFGPPNLPCKLIDGAFIAVDNAAMEASGLRFDENFKFHFYDMDFCRQAESLGLRMGTCGISGLHVSPGGYGSPTWTAGYLAYITKWGG